MPLAHLVDTFNDVFVHEHHFSFRPFILHGGQVSGLFGPLRIDSVFSPIRKAANPIEIVGHDANIEVAVNNNLFLQENEIISLLTNRESYQSNLESIISFDRLARTVHVLNYLTVLPVYKLLFMDVDPRHILGVKKDHGVYFQEFITKAGLETANVVVALTVYDQYASYYPELLAGLENYRLHGYQVALKFEKFPKNNALYDLITKSFPDYISISARTLEFNHEEFTEETLREFTEFARSTNSKTLLQQIDHKHNHWLAQNSGFDFAEGGFYRSIPYENKNTRSKNTTTKTFNHNFYITR